MKEKLSRLEIAELCLKYKDTPDQLPDLTTTEFCNFVKAGDLASKVRTFDELLRILKISGTIKDVFGVKTNGKHRSRYKINVYYIWPYLREKGYVSVNLFEYCDELLDTKPKQLKPFTSEYFEQNFAVGSIIMIRFSLYKAKYTRRAQLTEILYKPDSVSEISAVTFGGHSYTLEELKDNLEYFQNDQWLPFGVYE